MKTLLLLCLDEMKKGRVFASTYAAEQRTKAIKPPELAGWDSPIPVFVEK